MNDDELMKNIDISDIPKTYQPIADLIGLDNFLKMCHYAMGCEIYFPMMDSMIRKTRNRLIIEEYNGYNLSELSQKYNLTKKCIRNIVKGSNLP